MDELEAYLIAAAKVRESVTYGEVFAAFGLPFQRFQVGALCAALDSVDQVQRGKDRPELAVLVVRGSDRLPGQGWWLSKHPAQAEWTGPFVGPAAAAYVRDIQRRTFDWWETADADG
ncbi:ribose-phosphate pyrophosphokinase [Sandaracinobacteroides saxicola]|uniref:Ribose-phosphate pyrophosphokinase n=1 Tax=Sandaracinobacteroides saxicola TaxID=2759707 RepID=A0A7G5IEE1_9SPHN|nr:ribose-phosphate pyrophosphokinase [Sandaracinobacteroides saxicola]QMW21733.1 ribose-phosphate pyrophosphokinase [Sandaracinobacteroides saxicola]